MADGTSNAKQEAHTCYTTGQKYFAFVTSAEVLRESEPLSFLPVSTFEIAYYAKDCDDCGSNLL